MPTLEFKALDGSTIHIERAIVESELAGHLILPGSESYDEARTIWNAMIDRRPALIVRASSDQDVVAAVNFAREHAVEIAVKGGGHNIAGMALVDGGLVLDLGEMQGVSVDVERHAATVQPGATLGDVDAATQAFGLVIPTGVNSTTGISGLTLGGGFGWTTRKYGLTIDSLRSARIVTAAGDILRVDNENNPELFWAIRGGGGNFGVVTEFEFDLHSAGPEVLAGMVVHPFSDLRNVAQQYQAALKNCPDELTCWIVLRKAPPLPFLAEEWHGKEVVVMAMCYVGELAAGVDAASEFRKIGNPIADVVGPMSFTDWQSAFDPLLTPGARNYWKSHDVASFSDDALQVISSAVSNLPSAECEVFLAHVGGQMTRISPGATPWPNRNEHFVVNMHTRWRDAADDERCLQWARELHRSLTPYAMGSVYVNFIPEGDDDQVANAYGSNYQRLRQIKRRFDPKNIFRSNQNIASE